jgi:energy-coupling factor transport system permease protein
VVFALVFGLSAFAIVIREDLAAMAVLFAITLVFALLLKVDLVRFAKRFKRLWQVLVVVALLRSVFAPAGVVWVSVWQIPLLTSGGLAMGVLVGLRLVIFILGAAMFMVYPARALIQGLVQIKMPFEIAYMVFIGLRFVPQLSEQLRDSLTALQLRGVVIDELKLKKRLSLYMYLLLPAVVSGLQNAKELAMSMEMRAFRSMESRTSYFMLKLNNRDIAMLCLIAVTALAAGLFMGGII